MPLNEAQSFHLVSNLTQKQQREAMESLYGLTEERTTMAPEMTYEERERLRQILAQHDAKDAAQANSTFDLNKPPQAKYVYREFPFVMYNHATGKAKAARDHVERERLIAEGWSSDPIAPEAPPEIPLTAAEQAEADTINTQLRKKKT